MEKVYGFTNEFVAAYPDIYNFDNADVLSVIGSGDQYFTSILAGAKNVTLFDININAWHHFVLKSTAIKHLAYEEFWKFFITDGLNNIELYLKIRDYLPQETKHFFDLLRVTKMKFSSIKLKALLLDNLSKEEYIRMLPYLEKENYYKLQAILNKVGLPECIIKDFKDISSGNERKNYDIMLLSNIYHWLDLNPEEFKLMLNKFDPCIIQAVYAWHYYADIIEFETMGFTITEVPAIKQNIENSINYVLTYKRTR